MRLTTVVLLMALVTASCAHRAPAPIESRPVQQAGAPAQTSSTAAPKPAPAAAETARLPEPEPPVPPGMHRVKRGETLIGISLEYGVDWRELAQWNQIANPNRIEVGQLLTVRAPAAPPPVASRLEVRPLPPATPTPAQVPAAPAMPPASPSAPAAAPPIAAAPAEAAGESLSWAWPANGGVITQFAEGGSKGIAIAGAPGEAVLAAERGRVVYSGSGLRGYGNLVIVKHSNDFITAYAHNRAVLVKEGQTVRRGQKIAELGMSDADRPMLHFELRKGGKPVDPIGFLPSR